MAAAEYYCCIFVAELTNPFRVEKIYLKSRSCNRKFLLNASRAQPSKLL